MSVTLAFALFGYLIPTVVAFMRESESRYQIAFWNVLTGWSGIVWILCLIFAVNSPSERIAGGRPGRQPRGISDPRYADLPRERKRVEPRFDES